VKKAVLISGLVLLSASEVRAHGEVRSRQEAYDWVVLAPIGQPGETPAEVTLQELRRQPDYYHQKMVRVAGRLRIPDLEVKLEERLNWELRDGSWTFPLLVLIPSVSPASKTEFVLWNGQQVEVLGRFVAAASSDVEVPHGMAGGKFDRIVVDSLRRVREEEAHEEPSGGAEKGGYEVPSSRRRKAVPTLESSFPRTGTHGIPLNTEFLLKFSTDMDEESFEGNVVMRYAKDDDGTTFPNLVLQYDHESTTLTVKPDGKLRPLNEIRLSLQRGIVSREGVPLVSSTTRGASLRSRRSSMDSNAIVVMIFTTRGYE
jgi:hypothetical protein